MLGQCLAGSSAWARAPTPQTPLTRTPRPPAFPASRSAMNSCPVDSVRVVILGQDPYHNLGQARQRWRWVSLGWGGLP